MSNLYISKVLLLNLVFNCCRLMIGNSTIVDSYNDDAFTEVSNILARRVKIFCIILTSPIYKYERAFGQKRTWLKRCNNYIYASSVKDKTLPSIKASNNDEYRRAYEKVKNALTWAWRKYGNEYDYYMKVDDDSYVIMENLRVFLLNRNPDDHAYIGFEMLLPKGKSYIRYIQGGSGFIMSRKTTKLLVTKGLYDKKYCSQEDKGIDDTEIGICLKNLGINLTHATDHKNKPLFCPDNISNVVSSKVDKRTRAFMKYSNSPFVPEMKTLSDVPIAFHYVNYQMMFVLEYLFYHAEVIGKTPGIVRNIEKVEAKMELIEEFSKRNY